MNSESFKPPRPGGNFYNYYETNDKKTFNDINSRITSYKSDPEYKNNYFYNDSIIEYENIDCTPGMCGHPYAFLRWFEMLILFILHWLIQVTCARTTCTMILTEFGYKAYGQAFILCVIGLLGGCCALILIGYSLNLHKAKPELILGFEKIYAILGILLMFICGIVGSYHAATTTDSEINLMGRGISGIRPQWIAAAVIEFLTVIVFIIDLIGQNRDGFPFVFSGKRKADDLEKQLRKREEAIRQQRIRESYY